jgi:DNA end-binding protein Ku
MAPRSVNSCVISFGLVSVPVKLYVACASEDIKFNMITPKGNRVKQLLTDSVTNEEVSRDECSKGYEFAKDQFVIFSKEEIAALDSVKTDQVEISEFVAFASVDLLQVEKTYYLAPDKGGNKAYTLLAKAMEKTDRVAVAKWSAKGKAQLVLIREYNGGLILHQMYYATEIRDFNEVRGDEAVISKEELQLAQKLVKSLSTGNYQPSAYKNEYADRVKDAVQLKADGKQVVFTSDKPATTVANLMDALQASLAKKK